MSKDTGGPAFPRIEGIESTFRGRLIPEYVGGMTLRDYFAAQVLSGKCSFGSPIEQAEFAYQVADAMIAERAK
jgi:hypothetical protein